MKINRNKTFQKIYWGLCKKNGTYENFAIKYF